MLVVNSLRLRAQSFASGSAQAMHKERNIDMDFDATSLPGAKYETSRHRSSASHAARRRPLPQRHNALMAFEGGRCEVESTPTHTLVTKGAIVVLQCFIANVLYMTM